MSKLTKKARKDLQDAADDYNYGNRKGAEFSLQRAQARAQISIAESLEKIAEALSAEHAIVGEVHIDLDNLSDEDVAAIVRRYGE